jgi:endonuclease-3
MTKKRKKEILGKAIAELKKLFPDAKIQLQYDSSFQLLVATILSAQCTDERVNKVTAVLFAKYKTPEDFMRLSVEKLERLVYSTGYYKAKSKHIKSMSKMLVEDFDGNVPDTMNKLLLLSGVGRKTANVILGHVFDTPAIVVDTHVTRIVNRLNICSSKNAVKIESELVELIDKKDWVLFTHLMINFGRAICSARSPKCSQCSLNDYCAHFSITQKKN